MSDRIPFDTDQDAELRGLRKGARRTGASQIAGYIAPDGTKVALTGDDDAPFIKIINTATAPVQVKLAGQAASIEVVGNIPHDTADSGNPVKVGGRAAASILGFAEVAVADRSDLATNQRGQLQVALGGSGAWSKFNTVLATPVTTFAVAGAAAVLGRLSITADEATAMYALVYDGTSTAGTLVDRFYIPASGTSVRDYTTEGGLNLAAGCFVALTTDPGAVTAPTTGGFCHAIYQTT